MMTGVASAATPPTDIHSTVVNQGFIRCRRPSPTTPTYDWTFNQQNTSETDNDHWQQRPQQVLQAHTSEVVSNYTDDAMLGESVQVAYTMPNGDFVVSLYEQNYAEDAEFNPTFTGVFTENPVNTYPPTDHSFTTTSNPGSEARTDASFTVGAAS